MSETIRRTAAFASGASLSDVSIFAAPMSSSSRAVV